MSTLESSSLLTDAAPTHRESPIASALQDLQSGLGSWRLSAWLGWRDAILPTRRTLIGPFWNTVQVGLWVLIIAGLLRRSLADGYVLYPLYVASGVVLFQFTRDLIVDGAAAYTKAAGLIQNIPNPLSIYLLRVLFKALVLLAVQAPVILIAAFIAPGGFNVSWLYAAPCLALAIWSLLGVGLFLASITPLYPDIPFALSSVMRVMFFATPVFWLVDVQGGVRAAAAFWNPFAHFLTVLRDPFLGAFPPLLSIGVVVVIGAVFWAVGIYVFSRTRPLIASHL